MDKFSFNRFVLKHRTTLLLKNMIAFLVTFDIFTYLQKYYISKEITKNRC